MPPMPTQRMAQPQVALLIGWSTHLSQWCGSARGLGLLEVFGMIIMVGSSPSVFYGVILHPQELLFQIARLLVLRLASMPTLHSKLWFEV